MPEMRCHHRKSPSHHVSTTTTAAHIEAPSTPTKSFEVIVDSSAAVCALPSMRAPMLPRVAENQLNGGDHSDDERGAAVKR